MSGVNRAISCAARVCRPGRTRHRRFRGCRTRSPRPAAPGGTGWVRWRCRSGRTPCRCPGWRALEHQPRRWPSPVARATTTRGYRPGHRDPFEQQLHRGLTQARAGLRDRARGRHFPVGGASSPETAARSRVGASPLRRPPRRTGSNANTYYITTCAGSSRDRFSRFPHSRMTSSTMSRWIRPVNTPMARWSVNRPDAGVEPTASFATSQRISV